MSDEFSFEPTQVERDIQFETVFKRIIPELKNHGGKIVAAQLMLILQLEGVLSENLGEKDIDLLESLKEKMLVDPKLCQELVDILKRLNFEIHMESI